MNIHPPLSSAPAVLLTTGLFVGAGALIFPRSRGSLALLCRALFVLGLVAVPVAYFTGLWSEEDLPADTLRQLQPFLESHEGFGRFSLLLAALPLLFLVLERTVSAEGTRRAASRLFAVSYVTLTLFVVYTSFLGGRLVFDHAAGVASPRNGTSAPAGE